MTNPTLERLGAWAVHFFGRVTPWLVIIGAVMTFNIVRAVRSEVPKPLPVLGEVPSFRLTDEQGRSFGSEDLRGKVWAANFIFTRCPTVCPAFSKKMATIQKRARGIAPAFHLVSFSVDPEYDTPEVLAAYAKKYRGSTHTWSFLTGDLDVVKRTVVEGLKIAMGNDAPDGNFAGIFHGSHFVLVDAEGRIRGYYESTEPDAVDRLLADAGWLANHLPLNM